MTDQSNPLRLQGIEFTEFASSDSGFMHDVFVAFGFSKLKQHSTKDITYYNQNDIHFLLNNEKAGFSAEFAKSHGPAICSMGWRVEDADYAYKTAIQRGAKAADDERKFYSYVKNMASISLTTDELTYLALTRLIFPEQCKQWLMS